MPAKPETIRQKAESALGCAGQEPLTISPTGGFVENNNCRQLGFDDSLQAVDSHQTTDNSPG
jgi:hypothetical protein